MSDNEVDVVWLRDQLRHLWESRGTVKTLEGTIQDIQSTVVGYMDEPVSFDTIDHMITATRYQNQKDVVDEPALKRAVGAKAWAKITRPVLDMELLEAALKLGEIDPMLVAEHTKTIPISKQYIRFSQKKIKRKES